MDAASAHISETMKREGLEVTRETLIDRIYGAAAGFTHDLGFGC